MAPLQENSPKITSAEGVNQKTTLLKESIRQAAGAQEAHLEPTLVQENNRKTTLAKEADHKTIIAQEAHLKTTIVQVTNREAIIRGAIIRVAIICEAITLVRKIIFRQVIIHKVILHQGWIATTLELRSQNAGRYYHHHDSCIVLLPLPRLKKNAANVEGFLTCGSHHRRHHRILLALLLLGKNAGTLGLALLTYGHHHHRRSSLIMRIKILPGEEKLETLNLGLLVSARLCHVHNITVILLTESKGQWTVHRDLDHQNILTHWPGSMCLKMTCELAQESRLRILRLVKYLSKVRMRDLLPAGNWMSSPLWKLKDDNGTKIWVSGHQATTMLWETTQARA